MYSFLGDEVRMDMKINLNLSMGDQFCHNDQLHAQF